MEVSSDYTPVPPQRTSQYNMVDAFHEVRTGIPEEGLTGFMLDMIPGVIREDGGDLCRGLACAADAESFYHGYTNNSGEVVIPSVRSSARSLENGEIINL